MTTSSTGLYGNFGQANYGAAKLALVGLMQTLGIEGAKNNIRVNALAPTAATRMTEDILTPEMLQKLRPDQIGRAPCRERVCQYVYILVVAVSLKNRTFRICA